MVFDEKADWTKTLLPVEHSPDQTRAEGIWDSIGTIAGPAYMITMFEAT